MANPTLTGSLNKQVFSPGEQIIATLQYGDADNSVEDSTVTWTATDAQGNSVDLTLNYSVRSTDPVTLSYADSSGRTWTESSDNGSVAVETTTA